MRHYSDLRRLQQRRRRLALVAASLACLVSTPAWSASPISAEEAGRMAAASPQRERYRDWTICINHVAALVIPQDGSLEKLRDMIVLGCDAEESRLTGALIAKYGYARGNAAMRSLWQSAEARFRSKITQRDHPPVSSNFFEDTAEGWKVRRITGGCLAMLSRRNGLNAGATGLGLAISSGEPSINFFLLGSDVSIANTKQTASFEVEAIARAGERKEIIPLVLTPNPMDGGIRYAASLSDALVTQLDRAETLQFRVPTVAAITLPVTYNSRGAARAWAAVQRCVAR